jgi:hypothetical protein
MLSMKYEYDDAEHVTHVKKVLKGTCEALGAFSMPLRSTLPPLSCYPLLDLVVHKYYLHNRGRIRYKDTLFQGHDFGVYLTHDVDNLNISLIYNAIRSSYYSVKRRRFDALRSINLNYEKLTNHIVDCEENRGVRAFWFFLSSTRKFLKLLPLPGYGDNSLDDEIALRLAQSLVSKGLTVGLHIPITMLSHQNIALECMKFKKTLGTEARHTRTHYLRGCFPSLQRVLSAVGTVRSDFSLGSRVGEGFVLGTGFPFKICGIWEVPLTAMDAHFTADSRGCYRFKVYVKRLLNMLKEVHGVATFLFHPSAFDGNLNGDSYKQMHETLLNYLEELNGLAIGQVPPPGFFDGQKQCIGN